MYLETVLYIIYVRFARLAQSVERTTVNRKVV